MNFDFIIVVIGVVLIFEGLPWFLSPQAAKNVLRQLAAIDNRSLRILGFVLMLVGLFMVYFIRG